MSDKAYILQLLKDAYEELRLIRMKDCGVVYDPTIRHRLNLAIEEFSTTKVPKAHSTGFYRSVQDLLQVRHPEALRKWDGFDYRIYAPLSLDDEARLTIYLYNTDRSKQEVVLAL